VYRQTSTSSLRRWPLQPAQGTSKRTIYNPSPRPARQAFHQLCRTIRFLQEQDQERLLIPMPRVLARIQLYPLYLIRTHDQGKEHSVDDKCRCCLSVRSILTSANRFSGVSIGSGLLVQSGTALAKAGPVSLFLSYILIATVLYSFLVLQSLNETHGR
jgi:hypothetical protein